MELSQGQSQGVLLYEDGLDEGKLPSGFITPPLQRKKSDGQDSSISLPDSPDKPRNYYYFKSNKSAGSSPKRNRSQADFGSDQRSRDLSLEKGHVKNLFEQISEGLKNISMKNKNGKRPLSQLNTENKQLYSGSNLPMSKHEEANPISRRRIGSNNGIR